MGDAENRPAGNRLPGFPRAIRAAVPRDTTDALLAALADMAVRSPRRQADVAMAAHRAGLRIEGATIARALEWLLDEGYVERPLYLHDGGILLSVTTRGIEFLTTTTHRHVVVAEPALP